MGCERGSYSYIEQRRLSVPMTREELLKSVSNGTTTPEVAEEVLSKRDSEMYSRFDNQQNRFNNQQI